MDHIFEHYKKTGYLHHAHLIEGDQVSLVPILLAALKHHMGISAQGNPDLSVIAHSSFGIDEARALTEMQSRAGFSTENGSRKIFIISALSFTREAQNALLKTFEEPTAGTHFFIILPHLNTILSTLKSRVVLVTPKEQSAHSDTNALAEKFLGASLEERFAMAKKLTDKKTGESVDREKIRSFLDSLERILYTRLAGRPAPCLRGQEAGLPAPMSRQAGKKEGSDIFREIFQAKTYLSDRGSSPKMLIEHLAIAISV